MSTSGNYEGMTGAIAATNRDGQELRGGGGERKEQLAVYRTLDRETGLKEHLHGSMDPVTKLKFNCRSGGTDLQKLANDSRMKKRTANIILRCSSRNACADRMHKWETAPFIKKKCFS